MTHPSDTDLRACSGRALLVGAAISASLHLALALAVPERGGGGGLPRLSRPPRVVRLEMLRETWRPEVRNQKSEIRSEPPGLQERPEGAGGERGKPETSENRSMEGREHSRFTPVLTPDSRLPPPVSADPGGVGEREIRLVAGEGRGPGGSVDGGGAGKSSLSPSPSLPIGEEDMGGGGALEMWEVEEPPKQVTFVAPEYPSPARRMGVEGSVVVRYLVDQNGRVEQMAVVEGPDLLREASLRAVEQFVYEPIRRRGRAVKVWMRQVITFRLE